MSAIVILLIAMAVVIGSILFLRLHAFLALLLAALTVSLLTSDARTFETAVREKGSEVKRLDAQAIEFTSNPSSGRNYIFRQPDLTKPIETVVLQHTDLGEWRVMQATEFKMQPGDLAIHHTQLPALDKLAKKNLAEHVADGFGNTCTKLGILIALAAIIGKCLLDSGAAARIVSTTRNIFGERFTPGAFALSGFIVGIPVFFDTVFYLLMPLGKAMRVRTGKNYLLYILSIVVGATMAHSLVPPTPGPLLVAEALGIKLGLMMIAGMTVGVIAMIVGFAYAWFANRFWEIPLRPTAELSQEELDKLVNEKDEQDSPSIWLSLMPILLPVALLAASTTVDMAIKTFNPAPSWATTLRPYTDVVGNKNIALLLAAVIAIWTVTRIKSRSDYLSGAIGQALQSAGVIILITSAGGAFGHVLRQSGIAYELKELFQVSEGTLMLLVVAFGLTALVRVAQGSGTVAMITGVSIIAPLVESIPLPYHPVYLALAIGCGSKPGPWMNDSGFWIVGKMSGMTEGETLKTFTVLLTIMGLAGLVVTLLGATYLPLGTSSP